MYNSVSLLLFFFNDTATTEIYTLPLHDALPICDGRRIGRGPATCRCSAGVGGAPDRKSTRLNSSHDDISYAVFCLKKRHNILVPQAHTGSSLGLQDFDRQEASD